MSLVSRSLRQGEDHGENGRPVCPSPAPPYSDICPPVSLPYTFTRRELISFIHGLYFSRKIPHKHPNVINTRPYPQRFAFQYVHIPLEIQCAGGSFKGQRFRKQIGHNTLLRIHLHFHFRFVHIPIVSQCAISIFILNLHYR